MSQSDDFLKNIANLLQDTDSLLMEFDMRSSADVVEVLDDSSSAVPTISSDNDDDEVIMATPPPARRRRTTAASTARGGRRRNRGGGAGAGRESTSAAELQLIINQSIVDLCSPMAPPPPTTTRTRGRQASTAATTRGRRRGARTQATTVDNAATVELLDDSLTDAVAGPSGVVRAVAPEPEDGTASNNVSTGGSGPSCPICLCTWVAPVSTLCGHIFCKNCIAQWLKVTKKCPVCKAGPNKLKTHPIFC